jgi:hypothetical protein
MVAQRATWAEPRAQIKRRHGWLLEVEHLLDASLVQAAGESVSNETVGSRLDTWRRHMAGHRTDATRCEWEREALTEFLQVISNLRPSVVQCDDQQDVPGTNNDRERSLRRLNTPYRRVSGRKNGKASLLRYGRGVADAAWWEQDAAHRQHLRQQAAQRDRVRWRELRQPTVPAQREQRTRFRFRHKRQSLRAFLEKRWVGATQSAPLP